MQRGGRGEGGREGGAGNGASASSARSGKCGKGEKKEGDKTRTYRFAPRMYAIRPLIRCMCRLHDDNLKGIPTHAHHDC
jgi:hypothetical protein